MNGTRSHSPGNMNQQENLVRRKGDKKDIEREEGGKYIHSPDYSRKVPRDWTGEQ